MSEPSIRQTRPDDLDGLAIELAPDVGREQLSVRLDEALSGLRTMLVAVINGRTIGTVSYQFQLGCSSRSARLFALYVGRNHRRRGVATRLIAAVELEASSMHTDSVALEVAVANSIAIRLYQECGYTQAGEPFINKWTRQTAQGPEVVRERSIRMTKRLVAD